MNILDFMLSRHVPIATLFIALLFFPTSSIAQSSPNSSKDLLLVNARLVDLEKKTVHRGALQIEGDHITKVLDEPPSNFTGRTLDVEGKWVVPGLVDTHVHSSGNHGPLMKTKERLTTEGSAKVMLYSGVTAFLDLFNAEDYIFPLRNEQRKEGLLGADIYAAGPILTSPDGHGTQFPNTDPRTVTSPTDARETVASLASREPDVVKLVYNPKQMKRAPSMGSMEKPTMRALADAAQKHGLPTVAHIGSWKSAHATIRAGVDAITHTPPAPLPDSVVAAMQEQGTAWIPTLAVHTETPQLVQNPDRLDDELLQAVADSSLIAAYRDTSNLPSQLRNIDPTKYRAPRLNAVKKAAEAGIPILAGSDSGNPGTFQGYSLHRELVLLTQAGLSSWEALAAATTVPGRFLDAPFGLQPGDRANLLVLDASPIEDIRHTQDIHRVVDRGRVVDREALLEDVQSTIPNVPDS
jgi:imidazolonepropionase-like amidohydrolase